MSIIRNVITRSLRSNGLSSYERQAEPVIRDLEQALEQSLGNVRNAGRRLGATESQVNDILINAGLMERPAPPRPAAQPQAASFPGDAGAAVARLEAEVRALRTFAERHGYRA